MTWSVVIVASSVVGLWWSVVIAAWSVVGLWWSVVIVAWSVVVCGGLWWSVVFRQTRFAITVFSNYAYGQ